jgi:hypothetical protein
LYRVIEILSRLTMQFCNGAGGRMLSCWLAVASHTWPESLPFPSDR